MHNVSRIVALLLVVLATVLALVAFSLGRHHETAAAPPVAASTAAAPAAPVNTAHVVVAAEMLTSGEVIRAASLREIAVPSAPEGSYSQAAVLAGEVPRVNIPEGTVITASLLSNPIAMQLRPGERAMAVPVDEVSGVGYRVQPGDYVDVVLTLKIAEAPVNGVNKDHQESRVLASRLRVLAYGVRDLPQPGLAPPAAKTAEATEAPPKMAVLAVPLDQIDPLVLGTQSGKLSLALRHPGDDGMPSDLLFPLPATVLTPRNDLSTEQRGWLSAPENRAYAGIDDQGLLGHSHAPPLHPVARRAAPGLEIIRGSSTAAAAPHNQLAVTP